MAFLLRDKLTKQFFKIVDKKYYTFTPNKNEAEIFISAEDALKSAFNKKVELVEMFVDKNIAGRLLKV